MEKCGGLGGRGRGGDREREREERERWSNIRGEGEGGGERERERNEIVRETWGATVAQRESAHGTCRTGALWSPP